MNRQTVRALRKKISDMPHARRLVVFYDDEPEPVLEPEDDVILIRAPAAFRGV